METQTGMRWMLGLIWTVLMALLLIAVETQATAAEEGAGVASAPSVEAGPADTDPSTATAAADPGAKAEGSEPDGRIDDLEEKVDILAEEIGRLESVFAVPEELELQSVHGLGPAASKVYKKENGLSIGGYGEVRLRKFVNKEDDDQDDIFDALRAILYVGYKYRDDWVINGEFEFEHAGSGGGGSVSTEFLVVDYMPWDELNVRVGLVLVPMGFINEIHEPNFFFGAERPEIERQILPSTWRENGAGIYGRLWDRVEYRMYVINGFDGEGFDSGGLRGGRQKGSRALSNDFAFVARVDVDVLPGLMLGGSVYTGQSGQEQDFTSPIDDVERSLPDAQTTIYELHAQYKAYGASFRALWTQAFIDEAGSLSRNTDRGFEDVGGVRTFVPGSNDSIAQEMRGFYVEAAYDVLSFVDTEISLEPYFRYEKYDTQREVASGFSRDRSKDIELYTAGLQFKPIPEVVFKLDYRHFDLARGDRADQVQALVGYVF